MITTVNSVPGGEETDESNVKEWLNIDHEVEF